MNDREKELLESLGQAARDAYDGKTEQWEYRPECATDWWFDYCDDCESYHKNAYEHGYEVTKGHIEVVIWNCDCDGNWDVSDSYCLDDPDLDKHEEWYSPEAWCKQYREYVEHVAETGDDPCCEFSIKTEEKVREQWSIRVMDTSQGVALLAIRKTGEQAWTSASWDKVPCHLRDYLLLWEAPLPIISPGDFKTVYELQKVMGEAGHWRKAEVEQGAYTVSNLDECDIEVDNVIKHPDEQIRADLKAAARKYLDSQPKS
jgi:hypothetical protein